MFLVEGNKLVDELLSSNFKVENILVTDLWIEKFPEMAGKLPFYDIISQKQMEQISCMVTAPGIIATAHTPSYNINPEDAENEFILALDGITCIVVTHALDAALLSQYDSIITLKNGKIAESGPFDELIEKKGYFYSLYTVSQ